MEDVFGSEFWPRGRDEEDENDKGKKKITTMESLLYDVKGNRRRDKWLRKIKNMLRKSTGETSEPKGSLPDSLPDSPPDSPIYPRPPCTPPYTPLSSPEDSGEDRIEWVPVTSLWNDSDLEDNSGGESEEDSDGGETPKRDKEDNAGGESLIHKIKNIFKRKKGQKRN